MSRARELTLGKRRTGSALRAPFARLVKITMDPNATVEQLTDALQAADRFPDRRRTAEGYVYGDAVRRYQMLTGADYAPGDPADGRR